MVRPGRGDGACRARERRTAAHDLRARPSRRGADPRRAPGPCGPQRREPGHAARRRRRRSGTRYGAAVTTVVGDLVGRRGRVGTRGARGRGHRARLPPQDLGRVGRAVLQRAGRRAAAAADPLPDQARAADRPGVSRPRTGTGVVGEPEGDRAADALPRTADHARGGRPDNEHPFGVPSRVELSGGAPAGVRGGPVAPDAVVGAARHAPAALPPALPVAGDRHGRRGGHAGARQGVLLWRSPLRRDLAAGADPGRALLRRAARRVRAAVDVPGRLRPARRGHGAPARTSAAGHAHQDRAGGVGSGAASLRAGACSSGRRAYDACRRSARSPRS